MNTSKRYVRNSPHALSRSSSAEPTYGRRTVRFGRLVPHRARFVALRGVDVCVFAPMPFEEGSNRLTLKHSEFWRGIDEGAAFVPRKKDIIRTREAKQETFNTLAYGLSGGADMLDICSAAPTAWTMAQRNLRLERVVASAIKQL